MLYVVFKPQDCPKMFLFLYVWFTKEYFYQLFTITHSNAKSVGFGQLFKLFKNTFFLVFNVHTIIMYQYNTSYERAYTKYCNI